MGSKFPKNVDLVSACREDPTMSLLFIGFVQWVMRCNLIVNLPGMLNITGTLGNRTFAAWISDEAWSQSFSERFEGDIW